MVKWNVLDFALVDEGKTPQEAMYETVELAQLAEKLGYHRFWVAEHHNVPALANSSPELTLMHLANQTKRIRLGSGGVMLLHYSPLKVAENFKTLTAYHPQRIDLGIGNNLGTLIVKKALETKKEPTEYESNIQQLSHYLSRQAETIANPNISTSPELWLLSASKSSAKIAARQGMGYVYGMFFNRGDLPGTEIVQTYRESYRPSFVMQKPQVILAVFVVAGETEAEVELLAKATDIWFLGKQDFAEFKQFPSIETAQNYTCSQADETLIQANRQRMIVGTFEQVTQQMDALIQLYQADEVLMIPLVSTIEQRKNILTKLAKYYIKGASL